MSWRDLVLRQSLVEARGYLTDVESGRSTARELKALVDEMITPGYEGRVLIELLQNAHDAHPAKRRDGQIEFLLCEDEGDHGVLHVANGGRSFSDEDFKGVCTVGLSPKRPDEGIGHKGIGFKSVLQLTDAPEVYSVSRQNVRTFDGFCFRFAQPADFDWIAEQVAPDNPSAAQQLRDGVSSLKLPVPVDDVPESVRSFRRRGFVTVIRLPLRSAQARAEVERQLAELTAPQAPFELFLHRVAKVTIARRGGTDKKRTRPETYERKVRTLISAEGLRVQEVVLRRRMRLVVVHTQVDEATAREAIEQAVNARVMSKVWSTWRGPAEVSVAVPAGDPLDAGRLYAFLPMADEAPCPVPGFVNAPFFTTFERRSFSETVPWNALLLDAVARACALAALLPAGTRRRIPSAALVDLLCWSPAQVHRLQSAIRMLGQSLEKVAFLPVLHPAGDHTSLAGAFAWQKPGKARVFTPQALATAGVKDLIDPGLHSTRLRRLEDLGRRFGLRFGPRPDGLADWAERLALALHADRVGLDTWADFYADLSLCLTDGGRALRGKQIILGTGGELLPAGGTGVFVPRPVESAAARMAAPPATDTAGATAAPVPERLAEHLRFAHGGLPWSGKRATRRTQGLRWLEQQELVHPYAPQAVLDVVAEAMGRERGDDGALRVYLKYACTVWAASLAESGGGGLRVSGLLGPARDGWITLGTAMFGPGWPGTQRHVDDTLVRFLARESAGSDELARLAGQVIEPPEEILEPGDETSVDVGTLQRFLERQGVSHGLRPRQHAVNMTSDSLKGSILNSPYSFSGFPSVPLTRQELRNWRRTAVRWTNHQRGLYSTVSYRPQQPLCTLPGQSDYESFDDDSRKLYAELILHGLGSWPDTVLETTYTGGSDRHGTRWPTPLAGFLAQASWIPQQDPRPADGQATTFRFADASSAWWWSGEGAAPEYLATAPASLRARVTDRVRVRLALLGVRSWDDPEAALARLDHLAELVLSTPSLRHGRLGHLVRKANEKAWGDLLPAHGPGPTGFGEMTDLVVSREDTLTAVGERTEREQMAEQNEAAPEEGPAAEEDHKAETIYVADDQGAIERRLLDAVAVPVLPIGAGPLADRVNSYLRRRTSFPTRRTSAAVVEVLADGLPLDDASGGLLTEVAGPWLATLVAGLVEFDAERALRLTDVSPALIMRRIGACRLLRATRTVQYVDGHVVPSETAERSLFQGTPERGLVVTVHPDGDQAPEWEILQHAAPAVAALVGAPVLEERLQLALFKLAQRCAKPGDVADVDLADVLRVPVGKLEAVLSDRSSVRSGSARLVPLLACVDPAHAEDLQRQQETFHDRAQLHDWLASRVNPKTTRTLMRLIDDDDWQRRLTALGVKLADANRAWRDLDLPPVHNRAGHTRQFVHWLQHNRADLVDRVRDAFVPAYRAGSPLESYVGLRELPGLEAAPEWLDLYWDVPTDVLRTHAEAWARAHLPAPSPAQSKRATKDGASTRPVAELRDVCMGVLHEQLPRLRTLIDTWVRLHGGGGQAHGLPSVEEVARAMDAQGLLDFERLRKQRLTRWLSDHGYWPDGMPLTHRSADLALDQSRAAGQSVPAGPGTGAWPLAAGPHVVLSGKRLPIGRDDLRTLAREVASDVTEDQLAVSPSPLASLPPTIPRARRERGESSEGYTVAPVDPATKLAIGLAGEKVVGAWLHRHYEVPEQESWRSGLRSHVYPDGIGDDRLGYDFRITTPERTLYFEVKASTGADGEIQLGESEVDRARALKPDETYIIVYVSHVLDGARRHITPLPNPFGAPGLAGYRLVGNALRLRFTLPTMH
ncbi:sacsin N-terminal ATP-binding-like domain-containing protein [Streptomyces hirsutus]|uniref:sacsin N-terminal ATP-binding-like domain-containing protein n=1 Tax=Streptomyces hirsutus TaxID=35620 RepID=UPI00332010ED